MKVENISVCLSVTVFLSRRLKKDASRESYDIEEQRQSFTWAGEGLRTERHLLLFGDEGCGSTPVGRGKTRLLYHIVVLTVIFKYVMIVRANEGLLRWSSRAQFAFWLISSARWVDVCVSFGLIHIGFQCAMFCFVFFGGEVTSAANVKF